MSKSHYFDEKPDTPSNKNIIQSRISGLDFVFTTDSGVFSKNGIDFGSALLLETAIEDLKKLKRKNLSVLDFGCGYGPVGIVLKRVFPDIVLSMTDINERALELAVKNASDNHVRFVNIFLSDAHDKIAGEYDIILTNPPIRAGKKQVFNFYEKSFELLKDDGIIYVVIQKKQGAPSSEQRLRELFGNCEVIAKKSGYRILKSVKGKLF